MSQPNLAQSELDKLDHDLIERLVALDSKQIEVDSWEAGFLESMVRRGHTHFSLSPKQREAAQKLLDRYEVETKGEQEVSVKLPADIAKHFRRQP